MKTCPYCNVELDSEYIFDMPYIHKLYCTKCNELIIAVVFGYTSLNIKLKETPITLLCTIEEASKANIDVNNIACNISKMHSIAITNIPKKSQALLKVLNMVGTKWVTSDIKQWLSDELYIGIEHRNSDNNFVSYQKWSEPAGFNKVMEYKTFMEKYNGKKKPYTA